MNAIPTRVDLAQINAQIAAHHDRLTYAEAALIVAAERGPRPVVFVPATYSYPSVSNERLREQMAEMFAVADARSAWDRRVEEVQSCPVAAEVDRMHRIAKEG